MKIVAIVGVPSGLRHFQNGKGNYIFHNLIRLEREEEKL